MTKYISPYQGVLEPLMLVRVLIQVKHRLLSQRDPKECNSEKPSNASIPLIFRKSGPKWSWVNHTKRPQKGKETNLVFQAPNWPAPYSTPSSTHRSTERVWNEHPRPFPTRWTKAASGEYGEKDVLSPHPSNASKFPYSPSHFLASPPPHPQPRAPCPQHPPLRQPGLPSSCKNYR